MTSPDFESGHSRHSRRGSRYNDLIALVPNRSGSSSPVLTGSLLQSCPLGCNGFLPSSAKSLPVKFLLLIPPLLFPLGLDQLICLSGLHLSPIPINPALHFYRLLPSQSPYSLYHQVRPCWGHEDWCKSTPCLIAPRPPLTPLVGTLPVSWSHLPAFAKPSFVPSSTQHTSILTHLAWSICVYLLHV